MEKAASCGGSPSFSSDLGLPEQEPQLVTQNDVVCMHSDPSDNAHMATPFFGPKAPECAASEIDN